MNQIYSKAASADRPENRIDFASTKILHKNNVNSNSLKQGKDSVLQQKRCPLSSLADRYALNGDLDSRCRNPDDNPPITIGMRTVPDDIAHQKISNILCINHKRIYLYAPPQY